MIGVIVFFFQTFLFGFTSAQECKIPCQECKEIFPPMPQEYVGNWNLVDPSSRYCPPEMPCLYQEQNMTSWMCFCDPGNILYKDPCPETTAPPTEQPTVTFGPGCFSKDAGIRFYDLGKNRHGQNQAPEWIISDEGQTLSQRLNTRPSVGVTNLGLPNEPVKFSGRVYSNSSDDDVIGMVFGYQDETNFFVVASDNNPPGPMNWYVGRLHATCGTSCAAQTTISDAIWDPLHHPQEITVLANGTQHWEYPNVYEFSIWFNPSESLISVNVTVEGGEQVLHSGTISANTTKTDVDVNSRNGGHIGVYVDSQPNTAWEQLTCQNSILI